MQPKKTDPAINTKVKATLSIFLILIISILIQL
jgi:hypothetical protein